MTQFWYQHIHSSFSGDCEVSPEDMIEAAKAAGADFAVDIYPHYGSDVEATLRAGNDLRHGLIGAGVYASHGYERSHREGAENVLRLLIAYAL